MKIINKGYVEEVAIFIIKNKTTVRQTANYLGLSKTTVHNYITKLLPEINSSLFKDVNEILQINKNERCIRGGIANKKRWELKKKGE